MTENEYDVNRRREESLSANILRIKNESQGKRLLVWGIGKGASLLTAKFSTENIRIDGYIDKRSNEINLYNGSRVIEKESINPDCDYIVVSLLSYDQSIVDYLLQKGFKDHSFCLAYASSSYNLQDIIYKGCKVGRYTYGYTDLLDAYPMAASIGRYCSINGSARIWNNHPMEFVTTSPILDHPLFFANQDFSKRRELIKQYGKYHDNHPFEQSELRNNSPVVIGNDVWIGANVIILPGVIIGDGAVLAAGAVVTKNVEPYSIVGGVPAKVIRYRFSEDIIDKMLKIKWWDWPHEQIEENIEILYQPELFVKTFSP